MPAGARERPVPRSRGRRAPRHARAQGAHDRRRACSPACIAARSRASASSSPNTGSTCPATTSPTIDWKVYARSDRHYVKKFEEETNLDCHLLLDVSASMGYGSRGMTKLEYGAVPGGVARLPDEPPARRRRPDGVRRAHRRRCCRRARGPATCARSWSRSIGCSRARETERRRSRSTSSPTRSPSAAWSC